MEYFVVGMGVVISTYANVGARGSELVVDVMETECPFQSWA